MSQLPPPKPEYLRLTKSVSVFLDVITFTSLTSTGFLFGFFFFGIFLLVAGVCVVRMSVDDVLRRRGK